MRSQKFSNIYSGKEIKIRGICAKDKLARTPKGETRANKPPEVIYSDLCGPMEYASFCGARYFLLTTF